MESKMQRFVPARAGEYLLRVPACSSASCKSVAWVIRVFMAAGVLWYQRVGGNAAAYRVGDGIPGSSLDEIEDFGNG